MVNHATTHNLVLPSIIDDEDLSTGSDRMIHERPARHPYQMAFYVHALKLQNITARILVAFYHEPHDQRLKFQHDSPVTEHIQPEYIAKRPEEGKTTESLRINDLQWLSALDASLKEWRNNLPAYLDVEYNETLDEFLVGNLGEDVILVRQASVLQAR